jgi:hypothetical protein
MVPRILFLDSLNSGVDPRFERSGVPASEITMRTSAVSRIPSLDLGEHIGSFPTRSESQTCCQFFLFVWCTYVTAHRSGCPVGLLFTSLTHCVYTHLTNPTDIHLNSSSCVDHDHAKGQAGRELKSKFPRPVITTDVGKLQVPCGEG